MKLSEFEFVPNCPDEVFEAAKKWLKDSYDGFALTANFAVFGQDGKHKEHLKQGCHAYIASPSIANRCVVATENGGRRVRPSLAEKRRPFTKWFTQESMFSPFILNKDDLDFCCDYGFVYSADIPSPLLQNLCIIARHFFECPGAAFDIFNDLVSKGVPPMFAYIVGFNTNLSVYASLNAIPPQTQLYTQGSHRAWPFPNTLQMLKNLMTGEFGTFFEQNCDPKFHYRNFATIYGGYKYGKDKDTGYGHTETFVKDLIAVPEFKETLAEFRKPRVAVLGISNPFKKAPQAFVRPELVNYEELVEVVIPYLKEESII